MTTHNNATHGAADAAFSFSTTPSNTMNYKTHNQADIEYNYTCLQGYIDAGYSELINLFGKPTGGDKYKVDAEWVLQFEDGMVATIYNYKSGKNYNGDSGLATEQIRDWHIGGHDKKVVDRVQIILDLHREKRAAQKSKDTDAFESAYEIMDTIRKVKGENYARTVETGMLGKKMQDLFQLALGVAVARDGIPEEAGDLLNDMFSHMCAKQIALCANNGGLTKDSDKSDAEELMGWVDKIMDLEQDAAKSIMEATEKKKK
jgi:hypothetical protein